MLSVYCCIVLIISGAPAAELLTSLELSPNTTLLHSLVVADYFFLNNLIVDERSYVILLLIYTEMIAVSFC